MENSIVLTAETKQELNGLIDLKLKEGYLLKNGIKPDDDGNFQQLMILPNNMDPEMTPRSGVKLVIGLAIYVGILYLYNDTNNPITTHIEKAEIFASQVNFCKTMGTTSIIPVIEPIIIPIMAFFIYFSFKLLK